MKPITIAALALLAATAPAAAKWTQETPERIAVAGSDLSVVPGVGWNRWSKKPIRQEELWSFDGPLLNRIEFFGGIADGQPLARERDRKREPLPKFAAAMKPTDVAELIERTVRATEQTSDFAIEAVAPATFAGRAGFRLRYRYATGELERRGEARGIVTGGKLYLIAYSAPALHYFDTHLPRATAIMESARIG